MKHKPSIGNYLNYRIQSLFMLPYATRRWKAPNADLQYNIIWSLLLNHLRLYIPIVRTVYHDTNRNFPSAESVTILWRSGGCDTLPSVRNKCRPVLPSKICALNTATLSRNVKPPKRGSCKFNISIMLIYQTLINTVEGMSKVFTNKVGIFWNQYDILFEMTSYLAMRHCFQQNNAISVLH